MDLPKDSPRLLESMVVPNLQKAKYIRFVGLWLVGLIVLTSFDIATYLFERHELGQIVSQMHLGTLTPIQRAQSIFKTVKNRVKVVEKKGKFYDVSNRPTLRHSALETWNGAEGQCGEGARLIVRLLQEAGVPAARVKLSHSSNSFYHTAVALYQDDKWWLLDSISSSPEFHLWTEENQKPLEDLVSVSRHPGSALLIQCNNPYFDRYSFSPWARIFGTSLEVNQFVPFPQWVTTILETPSLIRAVALVAVYSVFTIVGLSILAMYKYHRFQEVNFGHLRLAPR